MLAFQVGNIGWGSGVTYVKMNVAQCSPGQNIFHFVFIIVVIIIDHLFSFYFILFFIFYFYFYFYFIIIIIIIIIKKKSSRYKAPDRIWPIFST